MDTTIPERRAVLLGKLVPADQAYLPGRYRADPAAVPRQSPLLGAYDPDIAGAIRAELAAVPGDEDLASDGSPATLAEWNGHGRLAGEPDHAGVDQLALVRTGQRAWAGVDREVADRLAVAASGMGGLRVDEVHRPRDLGFGVGGLLDAVVVVVGVDTEARRLALHPALGVRAGPYLICLCG